MAKQLSIGELRPTQMTHGERQIRQKAQAYRALSAHDLDMAIAEKPIAIVLGPHEAPYVIDHHHVANALLRISVKQVPYVLAADFSSLSEDAFWSTLEGKSWVYPYHADGRRAAFKDIPWHLPDAENDEFRSLAAFVRDAGGYAKTSVPLADFRWAELFRAHFPAPQNDAEFDALIERAVQFARGENGIGMPGFIA
jgi:hypothetical protein